MQLFDAKAVFLGNLRVTSSDLFKRKLKTVCITTPKQFSWKLLPIWKLFFCCSEFFVLLKPSAGGCRDSVRSRKWAAFLPTPTCSVGVLFCSVWMWFSVVCLGVWVCIFELLGLSSLMQYLTTLAGGKYGFLFTGWIMLRWMKWVSKTRR